MNREAAIQCLTGEERDIGRFNQIRKQDEHPKLDLSKIDLRGRNLSNAVLENIDFTNGKFAGATVRAGTTRGCCFADAEMQGVTIASGRMYNSTFTGADMTNATLNDIEAAKCGFVRATLIRAKLRGVTFISVDAEDAKFQFAELQKATLAGCTFTDANFAAANLRGTNFDGADLTGASLTGVEIDSQTSFKGAIVDACKAEKSMLESLTYFGGLAPSDRRRMIISAGLGELQKSYSGFRQWIHLISVAVVAFPYIAFLVKNWLRDILHPGTQRTLTIFEALTRYLWSGGENWHVVGWSFSWELLSFWSFASAMFALVYTFVRVHLLWKTKTLEHEQEITGLPSDFALTGWWAKWHQVGVWGFWINILAVIWHTVAFLEKDMPVPP